MLITPEYLFSSVSAITPAFLKAKGIAALVLDVDDTLTAHGSQQLDEEVETWLGGMRAAGVKMMIVSNNTKSRVSPFAARLGLPFVSMACKPLTFGLAAARRRFGVKRRQMAIVGDQLFTDRLAASFFGIPALVVSPRGGAARRDIQLKRKLERPFLRRYYQRGGKLL